MNTVLIIEDNSDNARLLHYALARSGYRVVRAENGMTGVQLAQKTGYTFILMDISLPDIDGLEVTRQIRTFDQTTPIVAITAHAMRGDRERILAAGCNGYLEKPYDPTAVIETIHNLIGREHENTDCR